VSIQLRPLQQEPEHVRRQRKDLMEAYSSLYEEQTREHDRRMQEMLEFFQRHPEELREIQKVGRRRASMTKRPPAEMPNGRAVKQGAIDIAEMF
jgi:hypothetical protein